MADANERKTPEEIKQKILEALNDKPLNAQEISKAINSNWSTVKSYIDELVEEGKIKAQLFGGSIIYQRLVEDTYYNIPITDKQRNTFKFIFSNAIRIHKEIKQEQIKRTELAKLTADLNSELNLKLPVVWYLYGPMPLMIMDLQKDYSSTKNTENSDKILKFIKKWIEEKKHNYVRELKVEYYQKVNNGLYQAKETLYISMKRGDFINISKLTREFYLKCLTYNDYFCELAEEFYDIVSGLVYLKVIEKNQKIKNQIFITFDSLWKYIASKMLYDSLLSLGYSKENTEYYIGPAIETKKYLAVEAIKDLDEEYASIIPAEPISIKEDEISTKIGEFTQGWIESETWRRDG